MSDLVAERRPAALDWSGSAGRWLAAVLVIPWVLMTYGLHVRAPWATWIWPWTDGRMTYVFLASIAAALAAALEWIAIVDEPAALAGVAINFLTTGIGLSVAFLSMGIARDERELLVFGVTTAVLTGLIALAFRETHGWPVRDALPQPRGVRLAFGFFVLLLVPLGASLVLRSSRIFPWVLPSGTSTIVGVIFLGASSYYMYGLLRGVWAHTGAQLIGFLAYDLVLFVPYTRALLNHDDPGASDQYGYGTSTTAGSDLNERNLVLYLSVVVFSALVAVYHLVVDPRTRIRLDGGRGDLRGDG